MARSGKIFPNPLLLLHRIFGLLSKLFFQKMVTQQCLRNSAGGNRSFPLLVIHCTVRFLEIINFIPSIGHSKAGVLFFCSGITLLVNGKRIEDRTLFYGHHLSMRYLIRFKILSPIPGRCWHIQYSYESRDRTYFFDKIKAIIVLLRNSYLCCTFYRYRERCFS